MGRTHGALMRCQTFVPAFTLLVALAVMVNGAAAQQLTVGGRVLSFSGVIRSYEGRITNSGPQVPAGYSSFILTLYNNVVKTLLIPNGLIPASFRIGSIVQIYGPYNDATGTVLLNSPPRVLGSSGVTVTLPKPPPPAVTVRKSPPPPVVRRSSPPPPVVVRRNSPPPPVVRRSPPPPPRSSPPPPPRQSPPPPPVVRSSPPPPAVTTVPTASLSGRVYDIKSVTYIIEYCGVSSGMTVAGLQQQYNTLADYFNKITYGAVSFRPENQKIVGPIQIPCSGRTNDGTAWDGPSCSKEAPWGWQQAADRIAQQQFGINPSAYPHKIIMTYNTKCAWAGLGTQACAPNNCIAWINRPANELSLDELAHEMGHNMGLYHSGRGADVYGDHSCVMGSWVGLRHYNAPNAWAAGFATTVAGGDLSSTSQMPAGRWLPFTLPPMSSGNSANMLRLTPAVTGTSDTYFVSFRAPTNYDVGIPQETKNTVQVHLYDGGQAMNTRQQSWVQAYLSAGQSWDGNGVVVKDAGKPTPKIMVAFDSMDSNAHVRVCRWQNSQQECFASQG